MYEGQGFYIDTLINSKSVALFKVQNRPYLCIKGKASMEIMNQF